jgi:hypothetical protein
LTPLVEGDCVVKVTVGEKPVKNAPLVLNVTPAAFAKITKVPEATATKPVTISMETGFGLVPADLKIEVRDSIGRAVTPTGVPNIKPSQTDVGNFELTLTLPKEGNYDVHVLYVDDGKNCQNSPARLAVNYKPKVLGFGPRGHGKGIHYYLKDATVGKPTTVLVDTVNLKPEDLLATVTQPNGRPLPGVTVKQVEDPEGPLEGHEMMAITFIPQVPGPHVFDLVADGERVQECPAKFNVAPKPCIAMFGTEDDPHSLDYYLRNATVGKPTVVPMTVVNLRPEDIACKVTCKETGKPIPNVKVHDRGNNKFELVFVPETQGPHVFDLVADGERHPECPKDFNVKPKPAVTGFGDGIHGLDYYLKDATVGKPTVVPMNVVNLRPEDVKCTVTCKETGKQIPGIKVLDKGDDKFEVVFVPQSPGPHKFDLLADGDRAPECPKDFEVKPKPGIAGFGTEDDPHDLDYYLKNATVGKPTTVPVRGINLRPEDLACTVRSNTTGNKVPGITVKPTTKDNFEITFVPLEAGPHKFNLTVEEEQVPGLPRDFKVHPKPAITGFGDRNLDYYLKNATVGKPTTIPLNVVNLKPEDVKVLVNSETTGLPLPVKLEDKGNNRFELTFIPEVEGPHKLNIVADGEQVAGLPKLFKVAPKPTATLIGDPNRIAKATRPFDFQLATINLKPEDVQVQLFDELGLPMKLPVALTQNPDNSISVGFTPQTPGKITAKVIADGEPLASGPVNITVQPAPYARLVGPSNRMATASKPFSIEIETVNVPLDELKYVVKDQAGVPIPVKVTEKPGPLNNPFSKIYSIDFVPPQQGKLIGTVRGTFF